MVLLTLVPIMVVLGLLVFAKWPADLSGLIGWLLTLAIACLFFHTSLAVVITASVVGLVSSFPVSLMVATSIFQINFLEVTGALKRIVVFVKTIARENHAVQVMIINMGIGTLLVAVGATPVSILPPIMLAMGYSTFVAVALPALGFDGLCTYALLGAPLVAFSDLTGTPLVDSARVFSQFMPIISTMIGFGMLWMLGGWKKMGEGFVPCLLSGLTMGLTAMAVAHVGKGVVLTGVFAGLATILIMVAFTKIKGQKLIDRSALDEQDFLIEKSMPLMKALAPWLILIFCCLVVNFYIPLYNYLYKTIQMPFSPAGPKPVMTRMLWNAYTWVIISTLLSVPFIKPSSAQWKDIGLKWIKRAPRPTFSAAIFFAIAYVMMYSGFAPQGSAWKLIDPDFNMISVLATSSAHFFKGLYPAVAAFLGLMGGFVTGSEASAIALFAKYNQQVSSSPLVHAKPLIVTAGIAIAGGLASVISPAKLQNAAATIDALGIESQVIKKAVLVALVFTSIAAFLTYIWA